ncbi:MAG: PAS domain-containing protein [Bacteroidales bacterium]
MLSRTIIPDSLDYGFLNINLKGEIDAIESYCNLTGYTRDELIGKRVTDLVVSLTPPEIKKKIESIIKNGAGSFESIHLKKDGNFCNLEIFARYLELGGGLIVAFLKDITEEQINREIMQARFEMISSINTRSVDELLQHSLDMTERMTRSSIGFFIFLT